MKDPPWGFSIFYICLTHGRVYVCSHGYMKVFFSQLGELVFKNFVRLEPGKGRCLYTRIVARRLSKSIRVNCNTSDGPERDFDGDRSDLPDFRCPMRIQTSNNHAVVLSFRDFSFSRTCRMQTLRREPLSSDQRISLGGIAGVGAPSLVCHGARLSESGLNWRRDLRKKRRSSIFVETPGLNRPCFFIEGGGGPDTLQRKHFSTFHPGSQAPASIRGGTHEKTSKRQSKKGGNRAHPNDGIISTRYAQTPFHARPPP